MLSHSLVVKETKEAQTAAKAWLNRFMKERYFARCLLEARADHDNGNLISKLMKPIIGSEILEKMVYNGSTAVQYYVKLIETEK